MPCVSWVHDAGSTVCVQYKTKGFQISALKKYILSLQAILPERCRSKAIISKEHMNKIVWVRFGQEILQPFGNFGSEKTKF